MDPRIHIHTKLSWVRNTTESIISVKFHNPTGSGHQILLGMYASDFFSYYETLVKYEYSSFQIR
jgi:hypothetical protein